MTIVPHPTVKQVEHYDKSITSHRLTVKDL